MGVAGVKQNHGSSKAKLWFCWLLQNFPFPQLVARKHVLWDVRVDKVADNWRYACTKKNVQQLLPLRNSREIDLTLRENLSNRSPLLVKLTQPTLRPRKIWDLRRKSCIQTYPGHGGGRMDSERCGLCNKSAVFGMWMWWRSKWETHLCLCDSKVFVWVFLSPEFQAWNGWLTPEYALIFSKRTFYLTLLRCFFLEHTWFTGLELGIFE